MSGNSLKIVLPKSSADPAKSAHADQGSKATFQFRDQRPETLVQRNIQDLANNSAQARQLVGFQEVVNQRFGNQALLQRKANATGMPDQLKSGIENLSGMSMDHVKVHYNSPKPASLQAHAYAQGAHIHLGPGQERHLPHEAWHVVQQAQGRVKPTLQLKAGIPVNDDRRLEKEADVMGAKALTTSAIAETAQFSGGTMVARRGAKAAIQLRASVIAAILQRMPKKKKKDDDEDEYEPPGSKKQKRFGFNKTIEEYVVKATAHRRKHFNKKKYKRVYTCPACRRPIAYKMHKGGLQWARYKFLSKKGNKKDIRALTMDHHGPWAQRLLRLQKRGASEHEMKKDYQDVTRLRAICKKCNESHKHEGKDIDDYESDTDEEGFDPPSNEPLNKDLYKDFRPPKGGGAGGGIGVK